MLTKENFVFDVVIPHLNFSGIDKCLKTLRERTPKENLGKVILINQSGSVREDLDEFVDIHIRCKNVGFAKANNMGIRLSDAEFVCCLNDDTEIIHPKYIDGLIETFNRYPNILCVNFGSPRNPRAAGDIPVNHPGFDYKEEWTEEDYDRMINEIGQGHIYDGITMFAPVFKREYLDKVFGVIPGKCWFDEYYFPGGGEDYDLCRRGYLTKIPENDNRGYRSLGTGLSYIWHWWYSTKHPDTGEAKVKYDGGLFHKKFGIWEGDNMIEQPDIYGNKGNMEVPLNVIREDL